jgi:ATP-dependent Lon protease
MAMCNAGLKRVLLPARNKKDAEEIGEETNKQLELVWLERVEDAVVAVLEAVSPERQRLSG